MEISGEVSAGGLTLSDRPRYWWSVGFLLPGIGVDRLARLGDITLLPVERDDHGQFQCTGTLFVETNSPGKDKRRSSNSQNQPEIEAAGMALPDRLQSLTLTWSVLAATIKEAQLSTGYRSAMRLSSKTNRDPSARRAVALESQC
jgi:hypothetical protein